MLFLYWNKCYRFSIFYIISLKNKWHKDKTFPRPFLPPTKAIPCPRHLILTFLASCLSIGDSSLFDQTGSPKCWCGVSSGDAPERPLWQSKNNNQYQNQWPWMKFPCTTGLVWVDTIQDQSSFIIMHIGGVECPKSKNCSVDKVYHKCRIDA